MKVPEFTEKSRNLLEALFKVNETGLLEAVYRWLRPKYTTIEKTDEYIYACGDRPVMLVAHLDTVFPFPRTKFTYDEETCIYKGEEGLGADDRAGVFAIIKIVERGYRPHLLFTLGEESGGWGAIAALRNMWVNPGVKYMIELDRANENDCVFYECDNPEFTQYIESFGFKTAIGSFTDISLIMPDWKVAGVNLSVGYHHEHTKDEDLHIKTLYNTINKVCKMLNDCNNIRQFDFIPNAEYLQWIKQTSTYNYNESQLIHCSMCNNLYYDWEDFPLEIEGMKVHICPECLSNDPHIRQCEKCYNLFYTNNMKERVCEECRKNTLMS